MIVLLFYGLAASTDSDACSGTGQSCSDISWDSQKRTHTLSNGEVIWDMAGNVWEWTSYVIADNSDKPSGSEVDAWSEYNTVNGTTSMAKSELISNSWSSTQGVGQYLQRSSELWWRLSRGGAFGEGSLVVFLPPIYNMIRRSFNGLVSVAFASESLILLI